MVLAIKKRNHSKHSKKRNLGETRSTKMPSRDVVPYIDVKFIDPVVPLASGWIAVGWPFASEKNSWSPDDEIVSPKNPSA